MADNYLERRREQYEKRKQADMADNYLERRREQYEKRKQEWLRKKRHLPKTNASPSVRKPEDEAL